MNGEFRACYGFPGHLACKPMPKMKPDAQQQMEPAKHAGQALNLGQGDPLRTIFEDDYGLLCAWRDILRDFLTASKNILKQTGVTTTQYQALLVIRMRSRQQLSMGELARHLRIRHNSAANLVNRMTEHGLVRRVHSNKDSRVINLHLTARGENLLRKLVSAHRRQLAEILPSLRKILAWL
jgi:DNA-binding MarR family transcriptional regulator